MPRCFSCNKFLALDATLLHVHHEQEDSAEEPAKGIALEPRDANQRSIEGAHRPNRNVNGMLSLFPEADIIASETNGPMKAEVLPI